MPYHTNQWCLARVVLIWLCTVGRLGLEIGANEESNDTMAEFVEKLVSRGRHNNVIHPGADKGVPTVVDFDIFFNTISSIDEASMDYVAQIFLRQRWTDTRLAFTRYNHSVFLDHRLFERIWVPDVYVANEKEGNFHELTVPNRLIEVNPDGQVLYSSRMTFTLACDMHLAKFPMDNQTCRLSLESYGYTTKDLVFRWNTNLEKPVTVRDGLLLPEFTLQQDIDIGECKAVYSTGCFACLVVRLEFNRQVAYYLAQTFIPTVLIVMLSWVSFWIDAESVPARVSLGLLTVLTMTTQGSSISARLPRVSYIKAIDIWMTVCLAFVFGALIQFSVVNVLSRKYSKKALEGSGSDTDKTDKESVGVGDDNEATSTTRCSTPISSDRACAASPANHHPTEEICLDPPHMLRNGGEDYPPRMTTSDNIFSLSFIRASNWYVGVRKDKALMLDVVSRVMFPLVFILFNMFYWAYYLDITELI